MYGSHCRHLFHKSCVDPWLLDHRTCPMCKMNILKALGIPGKHSTAYSLVVSVSTFPTQQEKTPWVVCVPSTPEQWRHVMKALGAPFSTSGHMSPLPLSPSENIVTLHRVCCFVWSRCCLSSSQAPPPGLQWVIAGQPPAEARATLMTLFLSFTCKSPGRPSCHAFPHHRPASRRTRSSGQRGREVSLWASGLVASAKLTSLRELERAGKPLATILLPSSWHPRLQVLANLVSHPVHATSPSRLAWCPGKDFPGSYRVSHGLVSWGDTSCCHEGGKQTRPQTQGLRRHVRTA